jgi:hypothetical protein
MQHLICKIMLHSHLPAIGAASLLHLGGQDFLLFGLTRFKRIDFPEFFVAHWG